MRPGSIRKFEVFYLGALALSVLSFVLGFSALQKQTDAQLAEAGLAVGSGPVLATAIALSVLFCLGLWYLVARQRVEMVKWVMIALFVWGLVGMNRLLSDGIQLTDAISFVAAAMQATAIGFLFRADAKEWFAGRGEAEGAA